jgi:hypothetical protein
LNTLDDLMFVEQFVRLRKSIIEDIIDLEHKKLGYDSPDYMGRVMYWSIDMTQKYLKKKFNIRDEEIKSMMMSYQSEHKSYK